MMSASRSGGGSRERARCIGFGEREGACGKESDLGLNGSGLFCTGCEKARRAHITESMARVTTAFAEASRVG